MNLTKQRLKQIDDNTFQEIESSAKKEKPLEWQRKFHNVEFILSNTQVVTQLFVHEIDSMSNRRVAKNEYKELFNNLKPNPSIKRSIHGTISDCEDKIYELIQENGSSLYSCQPINDNLKIAIYESEKLSQSEDFPNGFYYGQIFKDEDQFQLECALPSGHMDQLLKLMSCNPSAAITIRTEILSFIYEVEEALREHWMSRHLLIKEWAYAPISSIQVSCGVNNSSKKAESSGIMKLFKKYLFPQ